MTYIVIADDEDATFRIEQTQPNMDIVLDELRNMGFNQAFPPRPFLLAGWVSDVGNLLPDFDRNVVGSCVMASLGTSPQPLSGPLVITRYMFDEWGGPQSLTERQVRMVAGLYVAVREALRMAVPADLVRYRDPGVGNEEWRREVRDAATMFRDAPVQTLRVFQPPNPQGEEGDRGE